MAKLEITLDDVEEACREVEKPFQDTFGELAWERTLVQESAQFWACFMPELSAMQPE